jgi:hypothetical protein
MNYFARLAQRTGLAAPRGAVAPLVAAPLPSPAVSELGSIEHEIEVAAPAPSIAPSGDLAPSGAAWPPKSPGRAIPLPPLANSEEGPDVSKDAAKPTAAPEAPATRAEPWRKVERVVSAKPPPAAPPTVHAPPPAAPPDVQSSPPRTATSASPAPQFSHDASIAASNIDAVAFEIDVVTFAEAAPTRSNASAVLRQSSSAHKDGHPPAKSNARPAEPLPAIDESDNATVTATTGRTRVAPAIRRFERATAMEQRARREEASRNGPVEVHIGTVSLQMHAPATPTPPPARSGFAPHRHYLRLW